MRQATTADIPALVEMGHRFHDAKREPFPFIADDFAASMERLIKHGFVAIEGRGFIAGAIAPALQNVGHLTAHEILWWSEDGNGAALLAAFEAWAAQHGAGVKVSHKASDKAVTRLLRRHGYAPSEQVLEAQPCA